MLYRLELASKQEAVDLILDMGQKYDGYPL
jgi:hypothetical protein